MVWPAPSAAVLTTPIAVHVPAALGYEATSSARSFCAAAVVTCPPPPSATLPAGQVAVAVTVAFRAGLATDVTGVPGGLTTESRLSGGFLRLRGRDSNPDYLIQSQASYH